MIEPISVCELDAGRPRHHVPRFQMIAAISSANTIAKPGAEPTCRISSTGSSEMMPNATAPLETRTPRKLNRPDQTTATAAERVRVDDRRHRVGRVVEAVDELETERDQQRNAEQHVRQDARVVHILEVADEMGHDVQRCPPQRHNRI